MKTTLSKYVLTTLSLFTLTLLATGCGKSEKKSLENGDRVPVSGKDVKSQRKITNDKGEEMIEYTMKDGSKLEFPPDIDLNDPTNNIEVQRDKAKDAEDTPEGAEESFDTQKK